MSLLATLQVIDDLIMPRRCVFCGVRTGVAEESVCSSCRSDLPWIEAVLTGDGWPVFRGGAQALAELVAGFD